MKFQNINHETAITLDVNGADVSIKARPENNRVSGWAVIAFTPACSIRCTKTHRDNLLDGFAEAIAAAVGSFEDEDAERIKEAILSITTNPPQ